MKREKPRTVELGSMYVGGKDRLRGAYCGGEFSIGDTAERKIQWVQWNNLLVAKHCICTEITWDEVNKLGFIFGKAVCIDGRYYLCRSLKVGAFDSAPNEWDMLLNDIGDDLKNFDWAVTLTWGQEGAYNEKFHRVARGGTTARNWKGKDPAIGRGRMGFRPVLEPLALLPDDFGSLLGTQVSLLGIDCKTVSGELVGFSDYDLELRAPVPPFVDCSWAVADGITITVDRSHIGWLKSKLS